MTNKATKYGLMIIAAVLLVAMAFAGAASADDITAKAWNDLGDSITLTSDTTYRILGDQSDVIYPKYNSSAGFNLNYNLTLDFGDYHGKFYGEPSSTVIGVGSIFGNVTTTSPVSLNIINLNLDDVTVNTSGKWIGGLVGVFVGKSVTESYINFTNCHLSNCTVTGNGWVVGGLVGRSATASVIVKDCTARKCDFESSVAGGNVGGFVGSIGDGEIMNSSVTNCRVFGGPTVGGLGGEFYNCTNCSVIDCSIESSGEQVGGLAGVVKKWGGISDSIVSNCSITGKHRVGGLIGFGKNVDNCELPLLRSNVTKCHISGTYNVGGLFGYLDTGNVYKNVSDCYVLNCNVLGADYNVGGIVGGLQTGYSYSRGIMLYNCKIFDSNVTGSGYNVGGIAGFIDVQSILSDSRVLNCNIKSSGHSVGGIVGNVSTGTITNCTVEGCNEISGTYNVGGSVGYMHSSYKLDVNKSKVIDSIIIGSDISSGQTMGGFVGYPIVGTSDLNNNTLENVVVKATNENGAQYAYLFDVSKYPINSTNGIAKLAQVNLANDNKIINSYVYDGYYEEEYAGLDGFTGLTTEFSIDVSNPKVTSIEANTFKNVKLTGLYNIDSVTKIKSNAFSGSNLTGGFSIPAAATLGSDVFTDSKLQVIYGDTTSMDLPDSVAKVNITAVGELTDVNAGSFVPKAGNVFENVTLGGEPAKYFKNLSSDSEAYLFASESWVAGNTYLALASAGTEITLDPVEGSGSAPESVVALLGNKNLSDDIIAPAKAGYTFGGWYNETNGGVIVINTTGNLNVSADGYTDAAGEWINSTSALTLYANWTVNQTAKGAENNVSSFGNDNVTTVRNTAVSSIVLESVNNVTGTVTFTADNTSIDESLPTISGKNAPTLISIFEITATPDGSGAKSTFYVNVTFSDIANKNNVKFFHYTDGSGWDETPLTSTIDAEYTDEKKVCYKVETDNFSPFGVGIYTAIPQSSYTSSSSHSTGYTQVLSEGQEVPTTTPTVAPTAAPTEQPATPTVIATEKPTTQATQQSPAPVFGILAGLGAAAAALARLRR